MTDAELADFLGIADEPNAAALIAAFTPLQRATYERMAEVDRELALWQAGLGPKPSGVLIDMEKDKRRRRAWGL